MEHDTRVSPRLLGTLCIAGALIGLADGIRLVALGRQLGPGLQALDTATQVATLVAALGGLCGVFGLIALRATGSNPVFRLLGYLPVISFVATLIAGLAMLAGVIKSDAESPVAVILVVVGDLLGPAVWLVVGILTIAARRLSGWRRFVPFAFVAAFVLGIIATEVTGLAGTFRIIYYAAMALLGYAVQRTAPAPQLRGALA